MTGLLHIVLARKPLEGTVAENCLQWGCGALWIDGTRVGTNDSLDGGRISTKTEGWDRLWKHNAEAIAAAHARGKENVARAESLGRWPANLILGGEEVVEGFPQTTSGSGDKGNKTIGAQGYGSNASTFSHRYESDSGSASRFFFNFSEQESDE